MSLHEAQDDVLAFHHALGLTVGRSPSMCDQVLRAALIQEEAGETIAAIMAGDLPEAVDGLVDLIYVCLGAAVSWGVDLGPVFDLVHEANMAKAGGGLDASGKVAKPPGWKRPDVAAELARQLEEQR